MSITAPEKPVFRYLWIALFLLLPLLSTESLQDTTLIPRYLLLAISTIITALIGRKSLTQPSYPRYFMAALGLFLLAHIISLGAAANFSEGLVTLARYLCIASYFILLLAALRSGALSVQSLIRAGLLAGGIVSLVTLFQLMGSLSSGDFFEDIYQISGTFSHKNLLASALMLYLPFALLSWTSQKGAWQKVGLAVTLLIILEIFVLRTRGVWLGLVGGAALSGILFLAFRQKRESLPLRWVAIFAGIAALVLMGLFSSPQIKAGFTSTANIQTRMAFWDNSWQMIREHPVIGVGPGNWKLIFPKYGLENVDHNVRQGITHIQRPHNDYLWVWSEAGPLGLIGYLALFALPLGLIITRLRSSSDPQVRQICYMGALGLGSYFLFSFGDFPLERATHGALFMSLVALIYGSAGPGKGSLQIPKIPLITAAIAALSLIPLSKQLQGEKATEPVLQALSQRNAQEIIPTAEKAENYFYTVDRYANPLRYYSAQGYTAQEKLPEALQELMVAQDYAPYNLLVESSLANVYKGLNRNEKALQHCNAALKISPLFKEAILIKAEILLSQKEHTEALDILNYHPYSSQERRYQIALARALRGSLKKFSEHGRFPILMKALQNESPLEQPMDYIRVYRRIREAQEQTPKPN